MSEVTVRPLIWETQDEGLPFARVPQWGGMGHKYQVSRDTRGDGYKAYLAPLYDCWFWVSGGHVSIEDAKDAAQADYQDRVSIDLVVSPKPSSEPTP